MSDHPEQPVVASPAAKPEHTWHDSIAETWHAGLRWAGLESEPKAVEPQHLEMKKFDFSKIQPDLIRGEYIERMDYPSMSEPCRREMFSKALHTHLDMSCINDVIKRSHTTDKK